MLAKINRLSKKKDFDKVFSEGRSAYNIYLGVKAWPQKLAFSRFGIVVSTKISKKAVERNKIKRQIRAIIRIYLSSIKPGFDLVIITLPKILGIDYREIEKSLVNSWRRLGLLN